MIGIPSALILILALCKYPEVRKMVDLSLVETFVSKKLLQKDQEHRDFLVEFGEGLFSPLAANLDGRWRFGFGEMELQALADRLDGDQETRTEQPVTLSSLSRLQTTGPSTIVLIERKDFSGALRGRTCKFTLTTTKRQEPATAVNLLALPAEETTEGYILFTKDGNSARVLTTKSGKPETYSYGRRLAQAASAQS